jgi:hypothetical protein
MSKSLIQTLVMRFVKTGVGQGDGVHGLLSNDLEKAVAHLDVTPQELVELVRWMTCNIPADCHGSKAAYRQWPRRLLMRQRATDILTAKLGREPNGAEVDKELEGREYTVYVNPDLVEELLDYEATGRELSSFPMALLENDLMEALTRADNTSRAELQETMRWIYTYLDKRCYGGKVTVERWQRLGGLEGIREKAKAGA